MNKLKRTLAALTAAVTIGMCGMSAYAVINNDDLVISCVDDRYAYISKPDGSVIIGKSKFSKLGFTGDLTIPEKMDEQKDLEGFPVSGIYESGFTGNSISKVTIGSNVAEIGSLAFSNCLLLTDVVLPDTITSMGTTVFSQTPFETALLSKSPNFAVIEGYILYLYTGSDSDILVPDGVKVVAGSAFANNGVDSDNTIKSVVFPESTEYVGANVFDGCTGLTKVRFSKNIKSIDANAFPKSYKGSILGYKGTCAEEYAKKNDLKFYALNEDGKIPGDANDDGVVNVRDAAFIAKGLAKGTELPSWSDFNDDGKVNVRDAAAIAKSLASGGK